ncbi:MAG: SirA-like protein [Ramlibacter sp.]|nr:SirA-like protein [Ramlibacter sp.]
MSRLSTGEQEFLSTSTEAAPAAPAAAIAVAPEVSGANDGDAVETIDARGISAPLPLLRAHRALRTMKPGQQLRVLTSSKETLAEFQALAKYVVGYELLSQEESGDEVIHLLRRRR